MRNGDLFDLSGTLVDDEAYKLEMLSILASEISQSFSGVLVADQELLYGAATREQQVELLLKRMGVKKVEINFPQLVARAVEIAVDVDPKMIPTAYGYLEQLRLRDHDVAITTHASRTRITRWLNKLNLTELVPLEKCFTHQDVVGMRRKPAPDIYSAALTNLGLNPAIVTAYEDTSRGIHAALGAGIKRVIGIAPSSLHSGDDLLSSGATEVHQNYKNISLV